MSSLLINSDSSTNGKLVNKLKLLWLAKIGRKTLWSLILTTTQISTPNWAFHLGTQCFQLTPHQLALRCFQSLFIA